MAKKRPVPDCANSPNKRQQIPLTSQPASQLASEQSSSQLKLSAKQQKRLSSSIRQLGLARVMYKYVANNYDQPVSFMALDFEMSSGRTGFVTEVGWSILDFNPWTGEKTERESQHIIVKDHLKFKNKYMPNEQAYFNFGSSLLLDLDAVFNLLYATIMARPLLFILFHDPVLDLEALCMLGFSSDLFSTTLDSFSLASLNNQEGIYVVDTQVLYGGWCGNPIPAKLEKCCESFDIETEHLHNAGNDAYYTLELFKALVTTSTNYCI